MNRTLVLDVVGLTPALLAHAPNLKALAARGGMRPLTTVTPAVTTTVQSTFVTGTLPREHGIVANGWYFRDLAEVWLWRQSNQLVGGEKMWDAAKPSRPVVHLRQAVLVVQHVRVGRLLGDAAPDVSGRRPQAARCLHASAGACATSCNATLGQFPLFHFWGPGGRHRVHRWIAPLRAARVRASAPDADARLSAASRLQPAATRPWRSRGIARRRGGRGRASAAS